jgi:hypothetical protein
MGGFMKVGLSFVALVLMFTGQASAAPAVSVVPDRAFNEKLDDEANVSGAGIVGLVAANLGYNIPSRNSVLTVSGIKSTAIYICVEIESSNGLYFASFTVPNPKSGSVISFRTPSKKMSKGATKAAGLAVRVTQSVKKNCLGEKALLPVEWGISQPGDQMFLAVNRMSATTTRIRSIDGTASAPCEPIARFTGGTSLNTTRFELLCPVKVDKSCGTPQEFIITRKDAAMPRSPSTQNITAPCN